MRQDVVAGPTQNPPFPLLSEAPRDSDEFNSTQAIAEGWMIVRAANRHRAWQLQRVDDIATFRTDVDAWCFVFDRAEQGSEYHQNAIAFLAQQPERRAV